MGLNFVVLSFLAVHMPSSDVINFCLKKKNMFCVFLFVLLDMGLKQSTNHNFMSE